MPVATRSMRRGLLQRNAMMTILAARFSSRILPACARRSPKVGEVIPILYLRMLSTGDFRPALEGLLGEDASGLSASTVSRLCKECEAGDFYFGGDESGRDRDHEPA